jgi:hypothetical protein
MKNSVLWDVTLCGSCKTDVSEGCSAFNIALKRMGVLGTTLALTVNFLASHRSVLHLLGTIDIIPSSLILSTLMMQAIPSSETSVLIIAIRCHIPDDGILHSNILD